jgi:hypothetical protein
VDLVDANVSRSPQLGISWERVLNSFCGNPYYWADSIPLKTIGIAFENEYVWLLSLMEPMREKNEKASMEYTQNCLRPKFFTFLQFT